MSQSYMAGWRRARQAWLGWLLAASSPLWPNRAAADDQLAWQAPPECPGREQVQAELARLLARAPRTADASAPTVLITRVSPSVLQARVSVHARQHVLKDASCEALTRAAALIVALAIDHSAHEDKPTPKMAAAGAAASSAGDRPRSNAESGSAPPDAAPASPMEAATQEQAVLRDELAVPQASERSVAPPSAASPVSFEIALRPQTPQRPVLFAREARVRPGDWQAAPGAAPQDRLEPRTVVASSARELGVYVGAALGVSSGIMPGLAPTFGVHVGLTRSLWCGALRLAFAPGTVARLDAASGAGGSVALALAALEGGVRLQGFGLEFPMLAGVESGLFLARGLGATEQGTHVSDWIAGYLSPGISHTWRQQLRFFLRVEGLLALRRPRFALEGPDGASLRVFHRPEQLAARIYLGLDVILR